MKHITLGQALSLNKLLLLLLPLFLNSIEYSFDFSEDI